jgi:hypothetical protein
MQRPERHRRVDAQEAARLDLQAADEEIGLLKIGQYGEAALVVGLPILGRAGAARRAVEELHTEIRLEVDDIFADRGAGQPQLARGL